MQTRARHVLDWWLGPEAGRDDPAPDLRERWFAGSPAQDAEIAREFAADLERASQGELDGWAEQPRGRIALVIVLDQWSRNLRRGTPGMYANDARALALARQGVDGAEDRALRGAERMFLYLPFMHSEALADQERSVQLFERLAAEVPAIDSRGWARHHHAIIARFGRFPHRNRVLGRESSEAEARFLEQPDSQF